MISVLISAYACSPNMGSEPGMAWNWCVNLAKYCELHIITEGEFRDKIERVLPNLPESKNIHFYYNPVSDKIRKMCWNQGDWRFYKHYKNWQKSTLAIANKIISNEKIDILHQLNMIGFREPGYLWKIQGIPFIWGPVDAKEKFPLSYLQGASFKQKRIIQLKNFLTKLQLQYSSRVKNAVKRASFVISASSNSSETFKKYFGIYSPILNETGCNVREKEIKKREENIVLNILWVGKLDFRKQLNIAIKSIAATNNNSLQLHIVGGGNDSINKNLADNLNITSKCKWYGEIHHDEVQNLMKDCDLFFFTSVAEGTPHVVLEAISNQLPVICFDTCGHGDTVNNKVGIKIPLTNPQQSVKNFAEKIDYLYHNRQVLNEMSGNCKKRQIELSWDKKAEEMVFYYKEALNKWKAI